MDQNGCSSPKAIFWVGNVLKNKKEFFWKEIIKLADKLFDLDLSKTSAKFDKSPSLKPRTIIQHRKAN